MSQHSSKKSRARRRHLVISVPLALSIALGALSVLRRSRPDAAQRGRVPNVGQAAGDQPARDGRLVGAPERKYLQQPGKDVSLLQAVTAARFGLKRQVRDPFGEAGSGYLGMSHYQNLNAWFGDDGMTLRPAVTDQERAHAWRLAMRLTAYGYGSQLIVAPPIVSHQVKNNRIEYQRADNCELQTATSDSQTHARSNPQSAIRNPQFVEWYENRAAGIEQGFTVATRPERRVDTPINEPLRLIVGLSGDLRARLQSQGQGIELLAPDGKPVLSYSKLVAVDASGKQLEARMETSSAGTEIVLIVNDHDAQYPIVIDPLVTNLKDKLNAIDGKVNDIFGCDVAISGDTIIVGAAFDDSDTGLVDKGAAYIFVRQGAKWYQRKMLTASDGKAEDQFGCAVDISGDTAVVGARYADLSGVFAEGKAYVFTRSPQSYTVWTEQKLIADPPAVNPPLSAHFGFSVAIDGNVLVIGAPNELGRILPELARLGSAYIFTRSGPFWTQQQALRGTYNLSLQGEFGYSVAVSGDTVIVGAPGDYHELSPDFMHIRKGAAYVFVRSGLEWTEQKKLVGSSPQANDAFGFAVGIDGDTAIIGASARDHNGNVDQGGVSVFERIGTAWGGELELSAGDGGANDYAGSAVAISGDKALVGAFRHDVNDQVDQGVAYLLVRNGQTWARVQTLTEGAGGDSFGVSTDIDRDSIVVGSLYGDGAVADQGAVYIYNAPDSDGDGLPDDWEKYGITVEGVKIDLKAMGADPLHKDIFVHLDWMHSSTGVAYTPNPRAIKMVVDAFATAPVENPDRKPGVRLHVDFGRDSIMDPVLKKTWGPLSKAGEVPFQVELGSFDDPERKHYNWTAFDAVKALKFGPAKRSDVFHYALFCNTMAVDLDMLGLSKAQPDADFLVALGAYKKKNGAIFHTPLQEAIGFMHELGHNLGLDHGGGDAINHKPNYISIMNYLFNLTGLLNSKGKPRKLDYSRGTLPDLNERNLDELVGISDPEQHLTRWSSRTRRDVPFGSNRCINNYDLFHKFLTYPATDWNCDGAPTTAPVVADINGDGSCLFASTGSLHTSACNGSNNPHCDDEIIRERMSPATTASVTPWLCSQISSCRILSSFSRMFWSDSTTG